MALVITASRKAARVYYVRIPWPLPLVLFFVFSQKNYVAFIKKKFKALPLFGVLPLLIQIKIEVHALIRSVAFIRVLLLFGGYPRFDQFSGRSRAPTLPRRQNLKKKVGKSPPC